MSTPDAIAEAICWDDTGTILAVGPRIQVESVATSNKISVESMPGTTIIPGFVDAHMHFFHVGVRRLRPDLRGVPSLVEALAMVEKWLRENPGDGPVISEGWDESEWPEARFPSKNEIAALETTAGRPVVLRRMCGHIAVAGPRALAPIRAHWDDEELVDMETGILFEQPSLYLNEVLPVPVESLQDALQVATDVAHQLGVTCVGEYTQAPFRQALLTAAEAGTLRLRIANHIYVQQLTSEIDAGFRTGRPRGKTYAGLERMRDGGLKVFHDGSFGGRTALLREPYLDDPETDSNRGTAIWTDAEVDQWYQTAHAAGIQVTAHAIGDAAIDQGLDGYERLQQKADAGDMPAWSADATAVGSPDGNSNDAGSERESRTSIGTNILRHRFEHYELPHDDAIQRTVELGIVACSQPNFIGEWSDKGGMYERRLGPVYKLNNRYRSFLNAGMRLCFGSDGMPFGPLYGIESAMNHPIVEERLDAPTAVWLYTNRAAWACHWDDAIGTLEVGKRADALILDTPDLEAVLPTEWIIAETILDGETVHRSNVAIPHDDV
jgi:predicted amidohydrolase YtcJ